MLFVQEALEQSTHEGVAGYHASLYPAGKLVADLTAGIGADLIALAGRGPALGFELDPVRADYARHNVSVHGLDATVFTADCLEGDWEFEFAIADPARRVDGRRTLDPSEFEPDPVLLAERFVNLRMGVMKLSPLLPDDILTSLGVGLEFVSFGGECREALVFAGSEAPHGRSAVHVGSGERLTSSDAPVGASEPDAYLFDCDPALVRAHAVGTLCSRHGLAPLGDSIGYLTGPDLVKSPWLRSYRIRYSGKGDAKTTKRALRDLDARVFEVKQRGVKADPARLMKELAYGGSTPLSLALWTDGPSVRHLLLEAV